MKRICILIIVLFAFTHKFYGQYPKYLYGVASWYGDELAGEVTASGEIFDPDALTAAHKTLPFGTVVEVENLANGNTVEVTINDRGPYVDNRIIDLSEAAAEELGFTDEGTAYVKVVVLEYGEEEISDDEITTAVTATRSTSSTLKEEVVDASKLPVMKTNIVTNTVTVTNKVTSRFTNVITNSAFTYRDYSVEREAGTDLFALDTDYDDLFIIEEPETEPALPVDEYEWTPDTMDFYSMKPATDTNKSKNVVDLGVPENVDVEPEPLKMETNSKPTAKTTNKTAAVTADEDLFLPSTAVVTPVALGSSDTEFDFSFILDDSPITPDELMTNEYAIEIEDMYIETEASSEVKTTPIVLPTNTNKAVTTEVVYVYQTNYVTPEPLQVYVTNYVSVEVPKTNKVQLPVTINVRNTNKVVVAEPEKITLYVTNYIEVPAKTNVIATKTQTNVTKTVQPDTTTTTPDTTTTPAVTQTDTDGISYAVQVGAFKKEANALALYEKLKGYGYDVFTTETTVSGTRYIRVRVGYFDTLAETGNVMDELEALDLPVMIVKVELVEE